MGFYYPREVGVLEGFWQRRAGPDWGDHGRPLVAAVGRTDFGVGAGKRISRVWGGRDFAGPGRGGGRWRRLDQVEVEKGREVDRFGKEF